HQAEPEAGPCAVVRFHDDRRARAGANGVAGAFGASLLKDARSVGGDLDVVVTRVDLLEEFRAERRVIRLAREVEKSAARAHRLEAQFIFARLRAIEIARLAMVGIEGADARALAGV